MSRQRMSARSGRIFAALVISCASVAFTATTLSGPASALPLTDPYGVNTRIALATNATGSVAWVLTAGGQVKTTTGKTVSGAPAKQFPTAIGRGTSTNGYWVTTATGQVYNYNDEQSLGSVGVVGFHFNAAIISMAVTPDGAGYWLMGGDGGIFSFGDARFFGSTGGMRLNKPVVGMASTPDGRGYWMVASDGGIFAFGDAHFYGSTGNRKLNQPIVGMTTSETGHGYRLLAADGGIFSFGDAPFYGSLGGQIGSQASAMAQFHGGYMILTTNGTIYRFTHAGRTVMHA